MTSHGSVTAGCSPDWRPEDSRGISGLMAYRLLLVLLLVSTAGACKHNKRASRTVLERASFDFYCPKSDIELHVIDEEGIRNLASQIAAFGCDQKAVYVFYPDADTWTLNGPVMSASAELQAEDTYHGQRLNRKENKAEKKANKKTDD